MYLDEIVAAQKRGLPRGIPSICSAHPSVLNETLKMARSLEEVPLIEATCNQVNQFGGYTGMNPAGFVQYVRALAEESNFPLGKIILGGDHLGPGPWQDEGADLAMAKSMQLVREYVEAGFTKIHIDCSMRLADDPPEPLEVEVSAHRAAQLARMAERYGDARLRYVIGTEVPVPGGAQGQESAIRLTSPESVRQTIEVTHEAFRREGLESAWERVIAVVVQPGVEFGDEFVAEYEPEAAHELSRFIAGEPMVFEAHSTDYQTLGALEKLVRGHFAILKVGPALTFAYREAVFALAAIENECFPPELRSNLVQVLEDAMMENPQHWEKHYRGTWEERALKRKYSLSDRIRYYWPDTGVQLALRKLFSNLKLKSIPASLLLQHAPHLRMPDEVHELTPEALVGESIQRVLRDYHVACAG